MMLQAFWESWEIRSLLPAYRSLLIVFVLVLITSVVIVAAYYASMRMKLRMAGQDQPAPQIDLASIIPSVVFLGLLGGLAGHLGGGSRESVVGELVPALFTLLGAYLAYYLGEKKDSNGRILVNSASFAICFFTIYNVSATWRQSNEHFNFCRQVYSNPDFATVEQRKDRDGSWEEFCQATFNMWTR